MEPIHLPENFPQLANEVLVWVGFGTIAGLVAKAIMPGRDPGGAIATLAMGIGGSVIGSALVSYFLTGHRITPISPIGFCVATGGAFVLLFFYRLLSGRFHVEPGDTLPETRAPYFRGGYYRRRSDTYRD